MENPWYPGTRLIVLEFAAVDVCSTASAAVDVDDGNDARAETEYWLELKVENWDNWAGIGIFQTFSQTRLDGIESWDIFSQDKGREVTFWIHFSEKVNKNSKNSKKSLKWKKTLNSNPITV